MGRLPKNGIRKSCHLDVNVFKTRHRHADSKYRSNVQYLYSKLKEMSQNKAAKEGLLSDTLLHIQSLEKEIIAKVGSDEMKSYQGDFVNFLLHEEALWKIKDTVKWWRKVEETLDSNDFINDGTEDFADCNRSNSLKDESVSSSTELLQEKMEHTSDISMSHNVLPCFSEFSQCGVIPYSEMPSSLLSCEEQNYFTNISVQPVQFENDFF